MRFTDEQRRAIDARDANILLSAAAGSGKTTVMIERILELVREGADLMNMLVVTFTNVAAKDMSMKLLRELNKRAAGGDTRMHEQQLKLESASITTLHSFCAELLRSNFETAGVDPMFRVIDAAEDSNLFSEALDEALEAAYVKNGANLRALDFGRGPKNVRVMAEALCKFLANRPYPEEWLAHAVNDGDALIAAWTNELVLAAKRSINEALVFYNAACDLPYCPYNYLNAMSADIERLGELIKIDDYAELYHALTMFTQTRPSFARVAIPEALKNVKSLRDNAKSALNGAMLIKFPLFQSVFDAKATLSELSALAEIALDAFKRHDELKSERSALNYDDLERFALRALMDEDTAREQRSRFEFVFVDEYQDISDVQDEILRRISRRDNLFMVGDVKQSIYRFRQAEPTLFQEKYRRYAKGEDGELLPLSVNFRSSNSIISFVNGVFERIMTGGEAEIEYDDIARLRRLPDAGGAEHNVEIHIVETKSGKQDYQSALIASTIKRMMLEDETLKYSDFAIITRTHAHVFTSILTALLNSGIPAYSDGSGGFFDEMEIKLALSLLKLIVNEHNDAELISVMRSGIMALSLDELASIRLHLPEGAFADAAKQYSVAHNNELAARLKRFFGMLDSWRARAGTLSMDVLVRTVLNESGFMLHAGALANGAQRQANLNALVSRARDFDGNTSGSLSRFLGYAEKLRLSGEDENAHYIGEDDDVVRVLTVHKSKGLEFRVVFAAFLDRKYIFEKMEDSMLADRNLGIGIQFIDSELKTRRETISRAAIAEHFKRRNIAEEMRVLYVTLTRAKERLILLGGVSDIRDASAKWGAMCAYMFAARSHLDLVMAAYEESKAMRDASELFIHNAAEFEGDADMSEAQAEDIMTAGEPDGEALKFLDWRYPNMQDVSRPLKLTASGIMRELSGPTAMQPLAPRPEFMQETGMTGAERGSAYHRVMQLLRLERLVGAEGEALFRELSGQMSEFLKRGLIGEREASAVDVKKLAAFFASELGKRLLRSPMVKREWSFNVMLNMTEVLTKSEAIAMTDEPLLVQGTIDCCFTEGDEWVLLDFKTDSNSTEEELDLRYASQLMLYALALERITGRRVKQSIIYLMSRGEPYHINRR